MATAAATATRRRTKARGTPLLPPNAGVAKIAGTDFIIMPLADFNEWQDDRLLAAVVAERLESGEKIVPFAEIKARLDRKKAPRPVSKARK